MLLRLKQASNEAFSFLSHDDPIHPYYVFLKSWGEAALGKEYARQQRLQVERAEAKLKAEADEKDRAAAAAKGPWLIFLCPLFFHPRGAGAHLLLLLLLLLLYCCCWCRLDVCGEGFVDEYRRASSVKTMCRLVRA